MERVEKSEEQREQPTTRQKRREERVICVGDILIGMQKVRKDPIG